MTASCSYSKGPCPTLLGNENIFLCALIRLVKTIDPLCVDDERLCVVEEVSGLEIATFGDTLTCQSPFPPGWTDNVLNDDYFERAACYLIAMYHDL